MPEPRRPRFTRREFLAAVGVSVPLGMAYAHWLEPRWLALRSHPVQLDEQPAPAIRVLHLSDLHWSSWVTAGMLRHAFNRTLSLQPDLICITGDFITGSHCDHDELAALLAPLAGCAPTLATLGNHDGGAWSRHLHDGFADTTSVRGMLTAAGIIHLDNASEVLTVRGRPIRVCGVGDLWAGEFPPTAHSRRRHQKPRSSFPTIPTRRSRCDPSRGT